MIAEVARQACESADRSRVRSARRDEVGVRLAQVAREECEVGHETSIVRERRREVDVVLDKVPRRQAKVAGGSRLIVQQGTIRGRGQRERLDREREVRRTVA